MNKNNIYIITIIVLILIVIFLSYKMGYDTGSFNKIEVTNKITCTNIKNMLEIENKEIKKTLKSN
ncbi:MAG: hypothetical protein PHN31_01655 [Candidatus Gracilibacteria bacterium]|nr:hypothetical protein [Candidatus Gracilibacteria bacterium]